MVSLRPDWLDLHTVSSNLRDVDSVVCCLRADKPDVARPVRIVDRDDQTVLVTLDVEHHSIFADDARVRVDTLDLGRRAPVSFPGVVVPRSQRLLGVGVPLPKLSKRTASDYPQRCQYTALP